MNDPARQIESDGPTFIVVVNHDGLRWLPECLGTLTASLPTDVPIAVVDDGSTDGSVAWVHEHFPMVQVWERAESAGFVDAANDGIARALDARAENVVLLNTDTRFGPGWFEGLQRAARGDRSFGVLGPMQRDFEGRSSPRTSAILRGHEPSTRDERLPTILDADWVEGSCLWLRRELLESVGSFDRLFAPAYFEEMDLCRRARRAGWGVGLVTTSVIEHHGGGTMSRSSPWNVLRERNYLLYHASGSDPSRASDVFLRALRHAGKAIARGELTPMQAVAAWRQVVQRWPLVGRRAARFAPPGGATGAETSIEPAGSLPEVSVVIPVRGRIEELACCLAALARQRMDRGRFEVIVCDDGTPFPLACALASLCRRRGVQYVRQPPRGPAAARNRGTRTARGPIVAFTDSDTRPAADWLDHLLRPFEDADVVAVEGPVRLAPADPSPLADGPRNAGGAFLTANMAYRRRTLVELGGFDERFPHPAFEDVELALCARRLGRIAFAADAVVDHPPRRWTLAGALARPRFLDSLLVTALRHGCLGWPNRPTRSPRWRVALAAVVTLPWSRIRKAIGQIPTAPGHALARIAIALAESAASAARVPRWLTKAYPVERGRYLVEGPA